MLICLYMVLHIRVYVYMYIMYLNINMYTFYKSLAESLYNAI